MDALESYLVLLLSFFLIIYILKKRNNIQGKNLPPSPPSLPIIGHLHHFLKSPLHEIIDTLTNKYGPVFLLRFGSTPMLVVSSRSAIEECFTKNDIIFANRPLLPSRKISTYNFSTLHGPYGNNWRSIRRFFALEIFSAKRLLMSSDIRNEEMKFMIKHLYKDVLLGKVADMKTYFYMLAFNIIMRMVAGNRGFGEEEMMDIDNIAKGKMDYFNRIFDAFGIIVWGDYIPFLRWLTYFKVEKKIAKAHEERDAFFQALIDAHRTSNHSSASSNNGDQVSPPLVDVLLKLQESEPVYYTDTRIKGILEDLPTGGTNSTVLTVDAAISQLVSHPEILNKARNQIDNVVGQSRLLADADIDKLPYLNCIINETLRIISVASILLVHESSEECTVAGYRIPRGTQLFFNPSFVHRDPDLWIKPDKFEPDRFLNFEEQKGRCRFIAFGSGRRQCPGMSLAMRVLPLLLGTMIQCFDWEKAEDESHGVVKTKVNNSAVRFRPREALSKVLAQL